MIRDIPSLQQQQPRDDDDDEDDGPQYAELAPRRRRTDDRDDRLHAINHSTAVYADIVHLYRPQHP